MWVTIRPLDLRDECIELFGGPPVRIVERFAAAAVGADQRAIETFGEALGTKGLSCHRLSDHGDGAGAGGPGN
ncbi:hypothetical protein B2G74_29670 [Burkholderia sp. A27]|nr:hypothetical protein B2G74_29670 [Burkholderia sp. A27]